MILATYETDGAADAIGVVDGQTIFDVAAGAESTPGDLVIKAARVPKKSNSCKNLLVKKWT